MKYSFALFMILVLALAILPVNQATAQALGNRVERVQECMEIRQNREATADDLADLDTLEKVHQQYVEAVEKGDLGTIQTLDHRFMNLLGEKQRESQKELVQRQGRGPPGQAGATLGSPGEQAQPPDRGLVADQGR